MKKEKMPTGQPQSRQPYLSHALEDWSKSIAQGLPHLSRPQAAVLALWSLGMVLARSCALSAVTSVLALGLKLKENSVRQRLREFYQEAQAKRGEPRQELKVETCFAPLLGWVLGHWSGAQLALALDATTLGDRFVVLAVSVLYRGCAIPIAWTVLSATEKHAWRGEWLRMLRQLRPAVPKYLTVIVLSDRGLYARWLFRRIVRLGWHPFLRINCGGQFCPEGENRFRPLRSFVPARGTRWCGRGTAFASKPARLGCTLLACWEEGYTDPWLILTDLDPNNADVLWYGLRAWIEQGFKLTKRGGWQWQRTRMTDPGRAARLWLAVAVATFWLLSVGGQADETIPESTFPELVTTKTKRRRSGTRWRLVGLFRRGCNAILLALIEHAPLWVGELFPEPWPSSQPAAVAREPDVSTEIDLPFGFEVWMATEGMQMGAVP